GALDEHDERHRPIRDDNMLLLLNAHHEAIPFRLPKDPLFSHWLVLLDTVDDSGWESEARYFLGGGSSYPLVPRSLALLKAARPIKAHLA
nr:glycogen debranching enzyme GlgX [Gammaproteobacteria bacterium]